METMIDRAPTGKAKCAKCHGLIGLHTIRGNATVYAFGHSSDIHYHIKCFLKLKLEEKRCADKEIEEITAAIDLSK